MRNFWVGPIPVEIHTLRQNFLLKPSPVPVSREEGQHFDTIVCFDDVSARYTATRIHHSIFHRHARSSRRGIGIVLRIDRYAPIPRLTAFGCRNSPYRAVPRRMRLKRRRMHDAYRHLSKGTESKKRDRRTDRGIAASL